MSFFRGCLTLNTSEDSAGAWRSGTWKRKPIKNLDFFGSVM